MTFSFIIPTRRRTAHLRRLLDSVRATTTNPAELEIVLVTDEDDEETAAFSYDGLNLRRVVAPPGCNMGALNMRGYRAATGEYLMLLNDDVILRTSAWDEQVRSVFRSYPDGMVLVHVNDLAFQDLLCIFPFLTREFCALAGGICDEGYVRYRIDDHIHNVFDLVSLLGQHRRVFLPDVVFEHTNVAAGAGEAVRYVPDPAIHEVDTRRFHALLEERRKLAMTVRCRVDGLPEQEADPEWKPALDAVTDSIAIRKPEHTRRLRTARQPQAGHPRVSIGVVSADMRSDFARRCVDQIKANTSNYELILIDNNGDPGFNHAREMNRILSVCQSPYLVLMDDDVFVEPGWLEGSLRSMDDQVGVVTPPHVDRDGKLSYAGVVMKPDESGDHSHILEAPLETRRIQTLCSAIMVISMERCGHLRLDPNYSKYFLDIDFGLKVWESGFHVVCTPHTRVTHLAGATLEHQVGVPLYEAQRKRYGELWVKSGRIQQLRRGIWQKVPDLQWIAATTRAIDGLIAAGWRQDSGKFVQEAGGWLHRLNAYPALNDYLLAGLDRARGEGLIEDPDIRRLALRLGICGEPILYEEGFEGMNIVKLGPVYCAVPQGEGSFSYQRMLDNDYSRSFEGEDPEELKSRIRGQRSASAQMSS